MQMTSEQDGYEARYMFKDTSPEILLPSNGGFNPKMKSIFVPADKTVKAQPPELSAATEREVKQPKPLNIHKATQMLRQNITGINNIARGGGRVRECLVTPSKNRF